MGPDGARDASPAGAVLSFLRPDRPFDADAISSFCHFVHFFVSVDVAKEWTAKHPGTFILSLEQGFELARLVNRAVFGAALGTVAPDIGSAA